MLWYGLATLAVYAVNAWAARSDKMRFVDALGVSVLLCASYLFSNALTKLVGWPDTMAWFPFLDAGFCLLLFVNWRKHPEAWKVTVMWAVVFQMICHVAAIYLWKTGGLTAWGQYVYASLLNGAFVVQLLAVGSVGIGHALARLRHSGGALWRRSPDADARP